jgi:large subunit ribosomal protein L17
MRHRKKETILGREKAPREALLRNLAASVILYEKVTTTQAKAKAVKPLVEKAITAGKAQTLANRRRLLSFFYTEHPVNKIFDVLAPRYLNRPGGYTRIVRLGHRKNDGADMVQIELV